MPLAQTAALHFVLAATGYLLFERFGKSDAGRQYPIFIFKAPHG